MNGVKNARIQICDRCPHRNQKHEIRAGDGGFARYCEATGELIELHDTYLEGPDSNCPEGHWADRVSIRSDGHAQRQCWPEEDRTVEDCGPSDDPETFDRWDTEQTREMHRKKDKPDIKQTIRDIAQSKDIDADAMTALAVLTAAGAVPGWMAEEIRDEMGGSA